MKGMCKGFEVRGKIFSLCFLDVVGLWDKFSLQMFVLVYRFFWKNLSFKEEMLYKYFDFKFFLKKQKIW